MQATRRGFLGLLLSAVALGTRGVSKTGQPKVYELNDFYIAGFQYHRGPALIHQMRDGMALGLAAEPENPYDPSAVRIEFGGRHVGYVPRDQNQHVCALLEQGATLSCRLVEAHPDAPPWEMARASITLCP